MVQVSIGKSTREIASLGIAGAFGGVLGHEAADLVAAGDPSYKRGAIKLGSGVGLVLLAFTVTSDSPGLATILLGAGTGAMGFGFYEFVETEVASRAGNGGANGGNGGTNGGNGGTNGGTNGGDGGTNGGTSMIRRSSTLSPAPTANTYR